MAQFSLSARGLHRFLQWALMLMAVAVLDGVFSKCAVAQPKFDTMMESFAARIPAKPSANDVLVVNRAPPRAFVQIGQGSVIVDADASNEELLSLARSKAAQLGADFIIATVREGTVTPGSARSGGGFSRGRQLSVVFYVFPKVTPGIVYGRAPGEAGSVTVRGFAPTSYAPAAGVRVGDRIVEIDGVWMDDWRIAEHLYHLQPGHVAKLLLQRGDARIVVDVPVVPNQ